MSERFPVSPSAIPKYSEELTPEETKYVSRVEKRQKHQYGRRIAAYTLAVTTISGANVYLADALENKSLAAQTQVSLETIQDQDVDSSFVFIGGYGSNNADTLAGKIGPAIQQVEGGSLESVRIGETPPTSQEIADTVIAHAEKYDKKEVTIFGHSLGGYETIKAATKIIQETNIRVKAIYLASTPSGLNTLRPEKLQQLNALAGILGALPYSEHSKYVKGALSLVSLKDRYMPGDDLLTSIGNFDADSFFRNWDLASTIANSKDSPSISVIEYQLGLARTNIKNDIQKLSETTTDQPMPTIIYLEATDDAVVNTEKASKEICEASVEFDIPCIVIKVDTEHERFYTKEAVAAYTDAIASSQGRIQSSFRAQEMIHAFQNPSPILPSINLSDAIGDEEPNN